MAEIWQSPYWPNFTYDALEIASLLDSAAQAIGEVRGLHEGLTQAERDDIILREFTREAIHSFSIEGVSLDEADVQASVIASMSGKALADPNRRTDAIIAVMQDARGGVGPMTAERLQGWHRQLFAWTEVEDLGQWRRFPIVIAKSNIAGRENEVLYRAAPEARVAFEMEQLLDWLARDDSPVAIRAAIAHLWFESIHPFSDGNGRIGRALIEFIFAQTALLPFSLSRQIEADKRGYYAALQAGRVEGEAGINATAFIGWFLEALSTGVATARAEALFISARNRFFLSAGRRISERQEMVLRRIWDQGPARLSQGISAQTWVKISGVSRATATRDLTALEDLGVVIGNGAGRSRVYHVEGFGPGMNTPSD